MNLTLKSSPLLYQGSQARLVQHQQPWGKEQREWFLPLLQPLSNSKASCKFINLAGIKLYSLLSTINKITRMLIFPFYCFSSGNERLAPQASVNAEKIPAGGVVARRGAAYSSGRQNPGPGLLSITRSSISNKVSSSSLGAEPGHPGALQRRHAQMLAMKATPLSWPGGFRWLHHSHPWEYPPSSAL